MARLSDTDFVALLRRVQASDDRAAEQLFKPLYEFLGHWARFHIWDDSDQALDLIDDVVSETVRRVVWYIASCKATSLAEFHTWVHAIGRHVAFDLASAEIPGRCSLLDERDLDRSGALSVDPQAEADAEAADEGERVLSDVVMQYYDALPLADQAMLYERFAGGADWKEVAAMRGTTPNGARQCVRRRCARLRHRAEREIAALPAEKRALASAALGKRRGGGRGAGTSDGP